MPSINELSQTDYAAGYRDGYKEGLRDSHEIGLNDGLDDALLLSMAAVDMFIDRSRTLQDFLVKWEAAKNLYLELRADAK